MSKQKAIFRTCRWACIVIAVCFLMTAFGCAKQTPAAYVKVAEKDVNAAMKTQAQTLATAILNSYESGSFKLLGAEATDEMRSGLTIDKQKDAHDTIKAAYGAFKSLDYAETWINSAKTLNIYRFKGNFSVAADKKPEIRVVFDNAGKLAGLFVTPWVDNLQ